jgi:hypothetical protein
MLSWTDIVARQERYADLLREAETERLIRQAMPPAGTVRRCGRGCPRPGVPAVPGETIASLCGGGHAER